MFFIVGILVLFLLAANLIAYFLGLSKRNWLHALGLSITYVHVIGWASVLLILVWLLGYRPTEGSAITVAAGASFLGYLSEKFQERLERSGKPRR